MIKSYFDHKLKIEFIIIAKLYSYLMCTSTLRLLSMTYNCLLLCIIFLLFYIRLHDPFSGNNCDLCLAIPRFVLSITIVNYVFNFRDVRYKILNMYAPILGWYRVFSLYLVISRSYRLYIRMEMT